MKFDSNIIFVAFFIWRFFQITFIEKHEIVLKIFSMCLKKTMFEWHTSLFAKIKQKMNYDLKIWKNQFLRKYRFNRHESLNKTMIMIFKFDEFLTLNQYLFRKTNFLHDAIITDENLMINYFWKNLDVKLILTTSIRQNDDILKNFDRKMRQNKTVAKKIWKFEKQNRFAKKNAFKFKWNKRNFSTTKIFFTNRMNKLFDKLFKADVLIKFKKSNFKSFCQSTISAKNRRDKLFFKFSRRFCKHCEKNHWNMNCKKKKKRIHQKKIQKNTVQCRKKRRR